VTSNVSVSIPPLGLQGSSLAEVRDIVARSTKAVGATALSVRSTTVNGKKAFRYDFKSPIKMPDGTTLVESQGTLLIPRGSSSTVVVITSSDDAAGEALVDEVLASVHSL
jgi:hypothetical protein